MLEPPGEHVSFGRTIYLLSGAADVLDAGASDGSIMKGGILWIDEY